MYTTIAVWPRALVEGPSLRNGFLSEVAVPYTPDRQLPRRDVPAGRPPVQTVLIRIEKKAPELPICAFESFSLARFLVSW